MSVMAMTSISEDELSSITGQSGVSIGADLTMNLSLGKVAWGDIDGLANDNTGSTSGGWVGIDNLYISNLRIHMRSDDAMKDETQADENVALALFKAATGISTATMGFYENAKINTYGTVLQGAALQCEHYSGELTILTTNQLLTIDIYTGQTDRPDALTGKTAVRIGLPTFEITMDDLTLNVGLFPNNGDNEPGTIQSLGQVYLKGMKVLIGKDNYVDISQNNTASGVLIHVGNKTDKNLIDSLYFDALSWGDTDGLATGYAGAAGYVGVKALDIAIAMDMFVNINVGTSAPDYIPTLLNYVTPVAQGGLGHTVPELITLVNDNLYKNDAKTKDCLAYLLYLTGAISKTSVDIALQGELSVTKIATQPVLASNAALTSDVGVLGNVYISGLTLTIPAYAAGVNAASWVSISAH
jgi:hypothetical protein